MRANQAYETSKKRKQDYDKSLDELGKTLKELQRTLAPQAAKP